MKGFFSHRFLSEGWVGNPENSETNLGASESDSSRALHGHVCRVSLDAIWILIRRHGTPGRDLLTIFIDGPGVYCVEKYYRLKLDAGQRWILVEPFGATSKTVHKEGTLGRLYRMFEKRRLANVRQIKVTTHKLRIRFVFNVSFAGYCTPNINL